MDKTNLPMVAAAPTTEQTTMNPFVDRMDNFNNRLLARSEKMTYMKYFIEARRECFPDIKFNFMGYFLTLTTKKELFCVPHDKLREYGVINSNTTTHVKRCLDQYHLIEGNDYRVYNVVQPVRQGGYSSKNVYILSQDAFKLCLMRAKNSREYANYYLMLEKVIGFQQKYIDMYNEKMLSFKDDKIDELTRKIDELAGMTREVRQQNIEIKKEQEEAKIENYELKDSVQQLLDDISGIKDHFKTSLEHRNERPQNPKDIHHFTLLQSKESPTLFRTIRSQEKYAKSKINKYKASYNVLINQYDPNPTGTFTRFKELVNDEIEARLSEIRESDMEEDDKKAEIGTYLNNLPIIIDHCTVVIDLDLISHEAFIERIRNCLNEKFNYQIEK